MSEYVGSEGTIDHDDAEELCNRMGRCRVTYRNMGKAEGTPTYEAREEAEKVAAFLKSQGAKSVRIIRV